MLSPALNKMIERLADQVTKDVPEQSDAEMTVPVAAYTDRDRFAAEQRLFRTHPVGLCAAAQLPKAGHCMTHDVSGQPLLIARGRDGLLRVFLNVCRHRSTRLVNEAGVCRKNGLVCPYHQWTYGLDGVLQRVPMDYGFPSVDPATHSLVEIPSAMRHGMLWARLAPVDEPRDAPGLDMAQSLHGMEADLAPFGFDDMTFWKTEERIVAANWKLVYDAFFEAYHVQRLHRKTLAEFFLDSHVSLERTGPHIRAVVGRKAFTPEVVRANDLKTIRDRVTFTFYVFPNTFYVVSPDYVNALTLWPQTPETSVITNSLLIEDAPKTDEERRHWDRSFDLIAETVFGGEDYYMAELGQRSLHAGANRNMNLGKFEHGVRMFHDSIDEAIAA